MKDWDVTGYLFVYGTLMRAAAGWRLGAEQREQLERESRFVGPATVGARLYDLGNYPGLVLSERSGEIVHGEIFDLVDADRSFRWLDRYESIVPGDLAASEYRRIVTAVDCTGTGPVGAWIYVYNRDLGNRAPVAGGRWLDRQ